MAKFDKMHSSSNFEVFHLIGSSEFHKLANFLKEEGLNISFFPLFPSKGKPGPKGYAGEPGPEGLKVKQLIFLPLT